MHEKCGDFPASSVTYKPKEELACLSEGLNLPGLKPTHPVCVSLLQIYYKVIHWPSNIPEIPQQPKSQLHLHTEDSAKSCSASPFNPSTSSIYSFCDFILLLHDVYLTPDVSCFKHYLQAKKNILGFSFFIILVQQSSFFCHASSIYTNT